MYFPEELIKLIKESISEGLQRYFSDPNKVLSDKSGNQNDKGIYSVEEAAEYLHMAVSTLRKKYKKKIISFVQEGRKITFRKEHLEDYLNKYTK